MAKDGDPVVKQLQPAATAMGPTFAALDEVAPSSRASSAKLDDVVDASEKGLPAFNRHPRRRLPSLLDAFQPFLRNVNPMVEHISKSKREVTGFLANTVGGDGGVRYRRRDERGSGGWGHRQQRPLPAHCAQTLSPESLSYYPRPLGTSRMNPYAAPGTLVEGLKAGGSIFGTGPCPSGNVGDPDRRPIPRTLAPLIQSSCSAPRTATPLPLRACKVQGAYPGQRRRLPATQCRACRRLRWPLTSGSTV